MDNSDQNSTISAKFRPFPDQNQFEANFNRVLDLGISSAPPPRSSAPPLHHQTNHLRNSTGGAFSYPTQLSPFNTGFTSGVTFQPQLHPSLLPLNQNLIR